MTPRLLWTLALFTAVQLLASSTISAQQPAMQRPETLAPDAIIRRFAEREAAFHRRFKDYSFVRDVTVQLIGMGGQIAGEYRRKARITLDSSGAQTEDVMIAPPSPIVPTAEDLKDFGTIQTFAIEPGKIGEYDFTYIGADKIDELDVYVFDVKPKILADPNRTKQALKNKDRFFEGRTYIDTQDFQLVKARGRGVPQGKQRYPLFETYREQVDGRHWFPSYTFGEDELVYPNGRVQRLRMRIKFTNYELKPGAQAAK